LEEALLTIDMAMGPAREAMCRRKKPVKAEAGRTLPDEVERSRKSVQPPEPTGTPPKRTPEEQAIVDAVAKTYGREIAERHARRIIAEARMIGDI
jgi:hypothetical protein